jgi:hypothetical protein
MALSYVNPKNGAVAPAVGTATDFNSFDYSETQSSESVIAYGAALYDPYRGNGTPHASAAATGIAKYGAANTPPGWSTAAGVGTSDFDGGTLTLTLDTGVTLAFTAVTTSIRVSHARARAAVPLAFSFEGGGDTTVTWPVA